MTARSTRSGLTVVLAVAVVLVATVLVRMLVDDGSGAEVTDAHTAAADDAVVVSGTAAAEVSKAAELAAREVLGYSWRTLDQDASEARVLLAEQMQVQYDAALEERAKRTVRTRTVVEATPVASSVVAVTESQARVLLFVNERTRAKDLEEPRVELTRVLLTLRRRGSDWLVTEIDSL